MILAYYNLKCRYLIVKYLELQEGAGTLAKRNRDSKWQPP